MRPLQEEYREVREGANTGKEREKRESQRGDGEEEEKIVKQEEEHKEQENKSTHIH